MLDNVYNPCYRRRMGRQIDPQKQERTLYVRGLEELDWRIIHMAASAESQSVKDFTLAALRERAAQVLGQEQIDRLRENLQAKD